jgi:hypothetical protein
MTTGLPSERIGQIPPHEDIGLLEAIPSPQDRALTATLYLDLIKVWAERVRDIRDDAIVSMLSERRPADVARALRLGATLVKEAPNRVAARRLRDFGDTQASLPGGLQ